MNKYHACKPVIGEKKEKKIWRNTVSKFILDTNIRIINTIHKFIKVFSNVCIQELAEDAVCLVRACPEAASLLTPPLLTANLRMVDLCYCRHTIAGIANLEFRKNTVFTKTNIVHTFYLFLVLVGLSNFFLSNF